MPPVPQGQCGIAFLYSTASRSLRLSLPPVCIARPCASRQMDRPLLALTMFSICRNHLRSECIFIYDDAPRDWRIKLEKGRLPAAWVFNLYRRLVFGRWSVSCTLPSFIYAPSISTRVSMADEGVGQNLGGAIESCTVFPFARCVGPGVSLPDRASFRASDTHVGFRRW